MMSGSVLRHSKLQKEVKQGEEEEEEGAMDENVNAGSSN